MILSYRIQLKTNEKQEKFFRLNAGAARFAYNWALDKHTKLKEQAEIEAKELGLETPNYPKIWEQKSFQYRHSRGIHHRFYCRNERSRS